MTPQKKQIQQFYTALDRDLAVGNIEYIWSDQAAEESYRNSLRLKLDSKNIKEEDEDIQNEYEELNSETESYISS